MALITLSRILVSIVLLSNGETGYELFSVGCQLELEGKLEQAIEYYKRAKEHAPESPEVYVSLATALFKIGKFDEGLHIATEGLSRWPDRIQMYHALAIGNMGKGDFKTAIEYYEKSLQIEPENIDVYTSLSILYEGTGNAEKASQILLTIPDSLKTSEVFVRLGALAGKVDNHEDAIDYYQKAYSLDTTNTTALIGVATGFDILNIEDSTIYYYEMTLREDTLLLTVGRRLIDLYAETEQYENLIKIAQKILAYEYTDLYIRRNLGYALYKVGMLRESLNEFLLASRLDPQDTYSRFYVGRIYLEDGEYEAAFNEIEKAIAINPDFVELWIYLGFIAIEKRDFDTAEYAFIEAAYRGGDMVQIQYLLGVVAEMQENYPDAYSYYRKSLKLDSKNLGTLEAQAHLCERIGKEEEAFARFKDIIEIDTANAAALNYVGYTYAERNDSLEYALELINKALSLEENNGYYIDSRGWVFYQMGRYDEALKDLKRAAQIVEDAVIFEHLGDGYVKLDEIEHAREAYQNALKYDPNNRTLKKKLKEIEKTE